MEAVDNKLVIVIANLVIASPAPERCDGGGKLCRFVSVAGLILGTIINRAVRRDFMQHSTGRTVNHTRNFAEKPEVFLRGLKLADGHEREHGVSSVSAEIPRIIRVAGSEAA